MQHTIEFVKDDGGREAAGFKGGAGDCVTRAIAIATGRPYREIYDRLADGMATSRKTKLASRNVGRRSARNGIATNRKWFKDYMAELGFRWVPTMQIGSGCTVHLNAAELPQGRIVCRVSGHLCAVIDGVLHDTYNCADRGGTVFPLSYPRDELPKGARLHPRGDRYVYQPERCVYGYWTLEAA